ncbi:MAG: acyl-CoA desaturase [Candidatus Uhrbacteria bacterium]|nr:acyl-CoA desaturase [Candidatus Uhrbacteria bacterium]
MQTDLLRNADERVNWIASIPFFIMHLVPLLAFFTGVRLVDIALCIGLYLVRMFFITAGYHRYFAHRSYKLGRVMQFLMAFGGSTAAQKGVLWWAGHHRDHHLYADTQNDLHSPRKGFWWSHVGWFLADKFKATPEDRIKDFAQYPELRFLDRHSLVPPTLLALAVFAIGGWSALVIGFFLSTILLYHGVFTINSLAHVFGRRRFATSDTSRNSWILALITLGEGWHNNHHHYRSSANQGFYWWEMDISYYTLRVLNFLRLARDVRRPPQEALAKNRIAQGTFDFGLFEERFAKGVRTLDRAKARGAAYYDKKLARLETFVAETKHTATVELGRHTQILNELRAYRPAR